MPVIKFGGVELQLLFVYSYIVSLQKELVNLTWHDVLKRVQQVQREQRMCIHKAELTELGKDKKKMCTYTNKINIVCRNQVVSYIKP